MCRPNQSDSVRPKFDCRVKPLVGSKGVSTHKPITLSKTTKGIAEGPAKKPDHYIVLFEHGEIGVVRASMHHTQLKGVEPEMRP